ncbi:MAG TPA: asparagine synthase (glutamine-hydrolyzing) [Phycisphaerae bacterium]|nr:asparagine synthase (glutamine-hydrolyzing) [Phycisphaerae bacterium]
MCGIAGIVSANGLSETDRFALGPMLDCLTHRGPDDHGEYVAECVALGHRRLSVIDLETGHQPMPNENGAIWAVVNGEIYNFLRLRDDLIARGHVFRSTSDSECLVHLYEEHGERCVEQMDGMFAFAVWNQPERTLLLGRDRLGVKPLYYCFDDQRLIFASELKAVVSVAGVAVEIDPTALFDYFTFSFIPSPKTILRGVNKLSPGCVLIFRDGRVTTRQYWDLQYRGWSNEPPDAIAGEMWERLKAATRPRLIADVPVGAFLSGGLDSTAVVTAMSRVARNRIVTITCGFEEQRFDERRNAHEVASLLGSQHHEELIKPDAAEVVETLCWHFDEPFADASAIPTYYLSRAARRHVTVALSGDGGDEALAGYRRYRFDQYEDAVRRLVPRPLRRTLCSHMASIFPSRPWMPRPLRAAATLRNLSVDAATAHGLSVSTLNPDDVKALFSQDVAREVAEYDPLDHVRTRYKACDAPGHLSRCQYVDIRLGLADGILTKVDRATMAHALEVRSPMLDHRFIEYAWSVPPRLRIRGGAGKYLLRQALARHLDRRIARRRKAGFEVPLDEWFAGPLRERFQDRLLEPGAALHDMIRPEAIRQTWKAHLSRRRLNGPTLWKLVMLDGWCRRFLHGDELGIGVAGRALPTAPIAQ